MHSIWRTVANSVQRLSTARPGYAVAALALYVVSLFIVGARWRGFLRALGGEVGILRATLATLGGIAAGNLWALARIIVALLPAEVEAARKQSRAGWALVAMLKMFGLVAAVWLLMRHGVVSPLPMLVGFGALPIGIAIGSLVSDRGARPQEP